MLHKMSELYERAQKAENKILALAGAHDSHALGAVCEAYSKNLITPILVGDKEQILKTAENENLDISKFEIIDEKSVAGSVKAAVELVSSGKAQILMKGKVGTSDILRGVLNDEWGLKTGNILSHFVIFELSPYHKMIAVTDAAMNIAPTLQEKIGIINNAVTYMHRLGTDNPKVALLGAVETVNPKMPATTDAALLTVMNRRKQITGCILDGPLAFDNAINKASAEHKGIVSEVAGDADILFTPDIEAGNILYKALTFMGGQLAAVILGAKAPIVLTSRADSEEAKLNSIVLAAVS